MTVMEKQRSELLRAASEVVLRVTRTLDTTGVRCPTCQLVKKSNWDEHQVAQELGAVVRKLLNCADRLEELSGPTAICERSSIAKP